MTLCVTSTDAARQVARIDPAAVAHQDASQTPICLGFRGLLFRLSEVARPLLTKAQGKAADTPHDVSSRHGRASTPDSGHPDPESVTTNFPGPTLRS